MKRIVSILLMACILFSSVAVSGQENAAAKLVEIGVLKGTENGLELDRNVTRAEAVVIITRLLDVEPYLVDYEPFSDCIGHWAYADILSFYESGFIKGTGDGLFEPERTVLGREFVKILLTADGIEGVTIDNAYDMAVAEDMISDTALDSAVKEDKPLTRGEVAQLCYNYINNGGTYATNFADKLNAYMPENGNYMYSPFSIRMVLALLANGAEDETQEEILNAAQIENLDEFNEQSKETIERYLASDVIDLNVANSLWVNSDESVAMFVDGYVEKVGQYYNAESKTVNNSNATEEVNGWVSEATNKKINNIINNPEFETLLVNAVYFNGAWMDEFSENATKSDDFTSADGSVKQIDFMNKMEYMGYTNVDGVQIVRLPYKYNADSDIRVSMYLLKGDEAILNPVEMINNSSIGIEYVELSLPKFKTEFEISLDEVLKKLGVVRGFTEFAQFAPMYGRDDMQIVGSLHKTYIKVDEKGTEAAAVTVAAGGVTSEPKSIVVKFNKPFSYVIMDDTNGEVLFVGRYATAK